MAFISPGSSLRLNSFSRETHRGRTSLKRPESESNIKNQAERSQSENSHGCYTVKGSSCRVLEVLPGDLEELPSTSRDRRKEPVLLPPQAGGRFQQWRVWITQGPTWTETGINLKMNLSLINLKMILSLINLKMILSLINLKILFNWWI